MNEDLIINIYEDNKIIKQYHTTTHQLTFGVIQDIMSIIEVLENDSISTAIFKLTKKLVPFIKTIFTDFTDEELIKCRNDEIVQFFIILIMYVLDEMGDDEKKVIRETE